MKRSRKASGLLSAFSLSLFGVSGVGCSAEGTPAGEALGTTSQATTYTPTGGPTNLQFMGELQLSVSKTLLIGGYNSAGTTPQTTCGVAHDPPAPGGTWTPCSNALPTALGEVQIAQITGSKFLVAGGRTARDGAATASAWILTLTQTASAVLTAWSRFDMGQARVIGTKNLLRCGSSGNRFIAIGGMTNGGMASATTTATDSVEVFNPATPGWSTLKISGTATVVKLPTNGKGYHQVLSPNVSKFIVAGGANSATASALSDVQILTVNSTCQALSGSVSGSRIITSGNAMPGARARGASIQSNVTISGVVYDFIVATGNDTTRFSATPPQRVFFYRSANDTWSGTVRNLTTNGRVFGRLVQNDVAPLTSVKMGTGVVPSGTVLFDTTPTAVDLIDSAGVVTAGTAMALSRVGAAVQALGSDYAFYGTGYSGGTATARTDIEDF